MIEKDLAIKVDNVSKTFRIPHEKITTIRGAFVSALKSHGYEEFQALDGVSFEVKKGEFFGIIGRNGSGKSTLLKIIAGIYQPGKGRVRTNGLISPFLELGIGFNPELSGRDNVHLNAAVLGLSRKQIEEKFDDIVEFAELRRFIDQKVKNYSSGMQVRLMFSVAIHANREILLMDEVLAVGDTNFQGKCLTEFNKYKDAGKTVILVTHDIGTVQRYCDRAMLIRNGKIEKIGKSMEVVDEYVRQNMSDEEKRIIGEEKKKTAQEKNRAESEKEIEEKRKIVRITEVEFLDGKGENKNVFRAGEDIVARIHYRAEKEVEKPIFGVAIHTQDGIHLTGPNTKTSHFPIESISGEGYVEFAISENPFFSGNYYFTAAIFNWDGVTPFDYQDKKYAFSVQSVEENQNGLVKLKYIWKKHALPK